MNLRFKAFTANDYKSVLPYFSLRSSYTCESHFLYHIIWKDFYHTQYCLADEAVLWLQSIDGTTAALPPISSKDNFKKAFTNLQDYFTNKLKKKLKLYLVDEDALKILALNESKYIITEDRDSFDYIYDGDKLRDLAGRKYSKKRNHINAFLRDYKDRFEYKPLSSDNTKEILEFTNKWSAKKNSDDPYNRIENEKVGIKNIMESYSDLDTKIAGLYIDGSMEAFTIGSYDPVLKVAAIHIEKANPEIRGLYPYINQQFLLNEFSDALYINREDDMGIPSLRRAKESYYPTTLAKKYSIIEK